MPAVHPKDSRPLGRGYQNIGHLETEGCSPMQLMSVSAVEMHLGYKSRSQLYKLMNDGIWTFTCALPDAMRTSVAGR